MFVKDSPEIRQSIVDLARTGLPYSRCAEANGISSTTLSRWRNDDPAFQAELDKARAEFIRSKHQDVASSSKPQDAQWLLERLDREHYGKVDRVEMDVVLDLPSLLPAEALRVDWKQWEALPAPEAGPNVPALEQGGGGQAHRSEGPESRCVEGGVVVNPPPHADSAEGSIPSS